jgi:hypothetical protein
MCLLVVLDDEFRDQARCTFNNVTAEYIAA